MLILPCSPGPSAFCAVGIGLFLILFLVLVKVSPIPTRACSVLTSDDTVSVSGHWCQSAVVAERRAL